MGKSEHLFDTIFSQNLSDGDANDFLEKLVKEHPYFTAAQFYLLRQTDPASIAYPKQAAKTSLLFNNPFWLDFQLNQSNTQPPLIQEQNIICKEEISAPIYDNEIESLEKIHPAIEISDAGLEEHNEDINLAEKIKENESLVVINAEPVIDSSINVAVQTVDINIEPFEKAPAILETSDVGIEKEEDRKPPQNVADNKPLTEYKIKPAADDLTVTALQQTDEGVKENYSEQQYLEDKEQLEDELPTEEKEIEPMNIKLNFTTAIATTEDTISFEPLHTSDYFASVGIKFSEEVKPGDKLGKQLKSFTDWLKTMKKIHNDQLPPQSEQSVMVIQKMAEKSNTEDEVLTEAMADVLLQQGKSAKAIEVYKKLSLLNPSKSAYFAAKIDHIKK
jgi:hypothetical protein